MVTIMDALTMMVSGFLLGVLVVGYFAVTAWDRERQRIRRYIAEVDRLRHVLAALERGGDR